jgi:hypothetical protein
MASPAAARKVRKPRQPKADGPKLYSWVEVVTLGVTWYSFAPDIHVEASLKPGPGGTWEMALRAPTGQHYKGTRPTLEEAYKATSDLLYKVAKPYWLREESRVVMAPWAHTLPED